MQQPAARRCCCSAQGSVGFALSDWTVWSSSWYGRGRDLCGSRWPLLFQHILGSFCILNNILYVTRVFMYFGISYDTKYLIKRCLIPPVSISSNFSHTPKASLERRPSPTAPVLPWLGDAEPPLPGTEPRRVLSEAALRRFHGGAARRPAPFTALPGAVGGPYRCRHGGRAGRASCGAAPRSRAVAGSGWDRRRAAAAPRRGAMTRRL